MSQATPFNSLAAVDPDPYLDLLKDCLTAAIYPESSWQVATGFRAGSSGVATWARRAAVRQLSKWGFLLVRPHPFDPVARASGADWPCFGYTMTGRKRLDNVQACVRTVIQDGIEGDLIETGVWRGGTIILMKAALAHYGVRGRIVWAADSFEGLPRADNAIDRVDASYNLSGFEYLQVSLEHVRDNVARFGLLDDDVRFLKGWFADTLPAAPIERLAVLRLDGDMYASTRDALLPLYPKVSSGGFVIVDDYHSWPGCRRAIDEYRAEHEITAPLVAVDDQAVWWRKP